MAPTYVVHFIFSTTCGLLLQNNYWSLSLTFLIFKRSESGQSRYDVHSTYCVIQLTKLWFYSIPFTNCSHSICNSILLSILHKWRPYASRYFHCNTFKNWTQQFVTKNNMNVALLIRFPKSSIFVITTVNVIVYDFNSMRILRLVVHSFKIKQMGSFGGFGKECDTCEDLKIFFFCRKQRKLFLFKLSFVHKILYYSSPIDTRAIL